MEIRILGKGDGRRLSAYLAPRADSSMILRSNLRLAGLRDGRRPYQGCYAAALSGSRVCGVVTHYWNGFMIPQAPDPLIPDLCHAAVSASRRAVKGVIGPARQAERVLSALGLQGAKRRLDSAEGLYALSLADLRVPNVLAAQRIRARPVSPEDRETLVEWFSAYDVECLGAKPGAAVLREAERRFERHRDGVVPGYVLLRDAQLVSFGGFNAAMPDSVQLGGIYTPKAERGRGFARAIVAHALREARAQGVKRAVLFTGDDNRSAQAAYRSLGFDRVGEFRLTELARPRRIAC